VPEELEDDSQVDSAFNPDRTTIKRYELVHRDKTKNCPKKVQFRQSCPVPYTNTDVVLVKIFRQRELFMKKKHGKSFSYKSLHVLKSTQNALDMWRKKGMIFD